MTNVLLNVVEFDPDLIPFCTECWGRVYRAPQTGLWWHFHGPDFYGPCDWGRPYPKPDAAEIDSPKTRTRGGRRRKESA